MNLLSRLAGMFRKQPAPLPDPELPIVWEGDLDDDCTAHWNGLILRAEWMHKRQWWWAVSVRSGRNWIEVDASHEHREACNSGKLARSRAEGRARLYVQLWLRDLDRDGSSH